MILMPSPTDLLKSKGYSIVNDFSSSECTCTINQNGITFSNKTVKNMKYPSHVIIGYIPEKHLFSIVSSDSTEPEAKPFTSSKNAPASRISMHHFKEFIRTIMPDWNLDDNYYKVTGRFNEDNSMAEFDLTNATMHIKRKKNVSIND